MPWIHGQQNLKAFIWTTWMIRSYWRKGFSSSSKWFKRDRPYTPWNVRFFQVRPWISQRLEDGPHFLLGVGQFSEANVILGGVHIIENIARNQINTFNTVVFWQGEIETKTAVARVLPQQKRWNDQTGRMWSGGCCNLDRCHVVFS